MILVDPGVKINGTYSLYRGVLLTQQLLPVMRKISGEFFIFQQDSTPAHRTLKQSAFWNGRHPLTLPQIFGSQKSTPEPADYRIWGEMQQRLYQTKVHDVDEPMTFHENSCLYTARCYA